MGFFKKLLLNVLTRVFTFIVIVVIMLLVLNYGLGINILQYFI